MLKKYLLTLFIFFSFLGAKATHIVGGEIYYDCLGNNDYRITLKIYRDCYNGLAPFDNPAMIGIYDISGNLLDSIRLIDPVITSVETQLNNVCFVPPGDVCVEEGVYDTIINLPQLTGGYVLVYQRCCRNQTILNLDNPGSVGSTYTISIPDPALADCNSSPRYNNRPQIFLCNMDNVNYDHSASDPDGDSLVYLFCQPLDGGSQMTPMPWPPSGPPFDPVPFLAPYDFQNMMEASPGMVVDPQTGLLTGTPTLQGQWVGAVCVEEYRNGQLISTNRRDFQFNVIYCEGLVISATPTQEVYCDFNVSFSNSSVNATSFFWDFGDPATSADTSLALSPTYSYSDSGSYVVTLIANPNTPCSDTSYSAFRVYPAVDPYFTVPAPQCLTGNSFSFSCLGNIMHNGTYYWTFDSSAVPATAQGQTVSGIHFLNPGLHPVNVLVTENGCEGSYSDTVKVVELSQLIGVVPPDTVCLPDGIQFSNPVTDTTGFQMNYSWNFGDGNFSNEPSPFHYYDSAGIYDITFQADVSGVCSGMLSEFFPTNVLVSNPPWASVSTDTNQVLMIDPTIVLINNASDYFSCITDFGDGTIVNSCDDSLLHTYDGIGEYIIKQYIQNAAGCRDTAETTVRVLPAHLIWTPNAFTPNGDGNNDFFLPVMRGIQQFKMQIFNRWGEMLFETNNVTSGWDGYYKGQKCPLGVYVFKIVFEDQELRRDITQYGHVTLLR